MQKIKPDIHYGRGPDPDEFEVTVFGPGYGEAISVHLGCGCWILVDSCVANGTSTPASADYLNQINVDAKGVKAIIATHWHDDHVRGISRLVSLYPAASFYASAVLGSKESATFVAAFNGIESNDLSRGTKEMYQSLISRNQTFMVKNRFEVIEGPMLEGDLSARVMALSPTDGAFAQFLSDVLKYLPDVDHETPIGHAPDIKPNLSSIVLHVDLGYDAILLGADLERHTTAGWDWIVNDNWCLQRRQASVVKIAHHGSVTGDHPETWGKILKKKPVAVMSPFNNGRVMLPTTSDRARILARTDRAYITSAASRRPQLPADQLKRLQDISKNITPVNTTFGAVRIRRRVAASDWTVEVFGSAGTLPSVA